MTLHLDSTDLRTAALAYAALGVKVFRVRPDKAPYPNCQQCRPPTERRPNPHYVEHRPEDCRCSGDACHGFYAATTDAATIERWWAAEPTANIGAPCKLNGWAVIDIDPRNSGYQSLCVLEDRVGVLPGTVMQITGGDGLHLIYRSPGMPLPGSLGPGLDLKHNGYVLLAPSVNTAGSRYRWAGDGLFRLPETPWPAALTPRSGRPA
jgi:hypothetical protein